MTTSATDDLARLRDLPRVDAIGPVLATAGSRNPFAAQTWSRRNTVAAIVLALLMNLIFRSSAGPLATGLAWTVLLGGMAATAGVTLATYLPRRRANISSDPAPATTSSATPCSAGAVLPIGLAVMVLQGAGQVGYSGLFGATLVMAAAAQRFLGASSCAAPQASQSSSHQQCRWPAH